jgi:peptidoglycan hydrolase CwlO-like protein
MKASIVMIACFSTLLFPTTIVQASSETSVSDLETQVTNAQKQVDQAQDDFDQAKVRATSQMPSSHKAEWQQAEAKFDHMMATGADSKKISTQGEVLRELESHLMNSSDREKIDDSRNRLIQAHVKLDEARSRLSATQKRNNDDSSQFTQPENRTTNGSITIRSERDSENHPPLLPSQ